MNFRSEISHDCKAKIYDLAMDINEGQNSVTLWSESEYGEFYLLKNLVKIIEHTLKIFE